PWQTLQNFIPLSFRRVCEQFIVFMDNMNQRYLLMS
ncbi:hypothetical protein D1AOALGA4SA_1282, partial [Olavius algarvensis Delta 1 endosymbiont]